MAEEEPGGAKEHEPTQKRLSDARAKGEIPKSPDLATAAGYAGFVLACVTQGPTALQTVGQLAATLLGQADRLSAVVISAGAAPIMGMMSAWSLALAPFFLFPAGGAMAAILAQQALIFAPEKLAPRLSRLSPGTAFAQKFGREGLFDFAKTTAKLIIVSAVLGLFLMSRMDEVIYALMLSPAAAASVMLRLTVAFLCLVLLISAVMGAVDYLWQRLQFLRRHRMTRQEVIDEVRQSEGDPHVKSLRRQRGQDIANNRMLRDVPRADVIIVNPTHYAVALVWNRAARAAPVCVAKGTDAVAARIRDRAAVAGVPIHRDPPTARALFASVEIGQQIRPAQYQAVAAAIRFAEAMRRKARHRG